MGGTGGRRGRRRRLTEDLRCRAARAAVALIGRCSFPEPGAPLDCAVSGGPDSLALLVLAVVADCAVVAHHVDHGLRPGSDAEAGVVRRVAAALGADVVVHRVAVGAGPNLEARARAARLDVLPAGVATGHTADDQAETVLINLLRGASIDGLAAMRPGARHPILGIRRAETHALCAQLGLQPVLDPMNADPAYLRNRVRLELLPMLCELAGRDLVPVLCRQSRLLADDADLLRELTAAIDPTDARAVSRAPVPLARRAVREWLREGHPPDLATVERVLEVAAGSSLAADVGGGRRVRRSKGRLLVARDAQPDGRTGSGVVSLPHQVPD